MGNPGQDGKSAYELYCDSHPEYNKSVEEWLRELVNGELATNAASFYEVCPSPYIRKERLFS